MLLELAKSLIPDVQLAGDAIMKIYHQQKEFQIKQDGSPVTEADLAAEKILLAALKKAKNDVPIISEENSQSHSLAPAEAFFLVDPLDGTKEFLKADGSGSFTVNIGFIRNGYPEMGIILAPALNRLFIGAREEGAFELINGCFEPLIPRTLLETERIAIASTSHRDNQTDNWLSAHNVTHTIRAGSSVKFCLIASGQADFYPRFGPTMEWDTAAGDAILRAAGGMTYSSDGLIYKYGKAAYKNTPFIAKAQPSSG
ncbi:3'(2'),5'-bisphosphate nucleotidase CysQ [Alphaproteobacteria bacterium]|nr:3'(2'),5'-bisphosphate nucleotidase CysQ [Alphaproteobacteria bacterium]MDC3311158.1 3'(2'),5'-bisphosphate nucleotidase CysQ [Alphaproteobacteria bacterium]